MKAKTPRVEFYKNATTIKMDNKRVMVIDENDETSEGFRFRFMSALGDPNDQRAYCYTLKNKVAVTEVGLSKESTLSLIYCLLNRLDISVIIAESNQLKIHYNQNQEEIKE
jgi:hypothetical protein